MSQLNPLNPAAGGVPVPEDEREVKAALRAGVVSYRVFPYLDWRFGERGEKFTRSDSAWLVWLTRHDQERVDEQISWLRNVLSNRGMPSWILELHLRVLYQQLVRTIPENERKYVSLLNSAGRLRQISDASIPRNRAKQLVEDFAAVLGQGGNSLIDNAAQLLVAALADEKSGVKNAVKSVKAWLVDVPALREIAGLRARMSPAESRWFDSGDFEQRWRGAIGATIEQARQD